MSGKFNFDPPSSASSDSGEENETHLAMDSTSDAECITNTATEVEMLDEELEICTALGTVATCESPHENAEGSSSGSGEEAVQIEEDEPAFEDALPSTEGVSTPGHMSPTPHSKPATPLKQQGILGQMRSPRARRQRTSSTSLSGASSTTCQSREPILGGKRRAIYTSGRPPWYDTQGQMVEPFVIGVCGGSASGKTTVARKIIEELDVHWVTLLSLDSFYKILTPKQHEEAERNEYNFDHPDAFDFELVIKTLKRLKEGKKVEVPIYNFLTHRRESKTKTMYGANVIIFEGILAFYSPELVKLLDMKVFVETDSDERLVRRLTRDITSRGRDLDGVLKQYFKFVKPAFDYYIAPSMVHADIIVPRETLHLTGEAVHLTGGETVHRTGETVHLTGGVTVHLTGGVTVHLTGGLTVHLTGGETMHLTGGVTVHLTGGVTVHLTGGVTVHLTGGVTVHLTGGVTVHLTGGVTVHLTGGVTVHLTGGVTVHLTGGRRGFKLREKLAHVSFSDARPCSLHLLPSTPQVRGLHTFIRNKETPRDEFIFYSKRLIRLVIEHALTLLPFRDVCVETPQGVQYSGKRIATERLCGVSILRAGETMEGALCDVLKDVRIGKILIQTNQETGEPELYYLRLPKDIKDYQLFVMDATVATGAAAMMAIKILLDHDVPEDNISLCSLLMTEQGVHNIAYAFPKVKIVTTAIDPGVNDKFYIVPGIGNFGDRYFGTEPPEEG
ncbi:Uridine kinase-like [Trinorchestia longiramus]|nr:Uridine kinase-like [Trinorchestia longiramus]